MQLVNKCANVLHIAGTFEKLHSILAPNLPEPYLGFGEKVIPSKERLYLVLWYMASSETNRALGARYVVILTSYTNVGYIDMEKITLSPIALIMIRVRPS